MAELTPTYDEQPVKAIIVTVDTGEFDAELSLGELEELAHTAGAEVVGSVLQKRPSPDTATYIGSGRLEELVPQIEALEADLLIFDCELTANQTKNIEAVTDVRVIDRTTLILDIFAQRALSAEGRIHLGAGKAAGRNCLPALQCAAPCRSRKGYVTTGRRYRNQRPR